MATKIRIILVAVLMAATFLCSCRSKEAVTKETTVSKIERQLVAKDSISTKDSYLSEDTTYSNEETIIHTVVYDTSKMDSDGKYPVKSITDVIKKSQAGSKGKASHVSTSTKVKKSEQTDNQKMASDKQSNNKVTSQIKDVNNFVTNAIWLIALVIGITVVIFFAIKYRLNIRSLFDKIFFLFKMRRNK